MTEPDERPGAADDAASPEVGGARHQAVASEAAGARSRTAAAEGGGAPHRAAAAETGVTTDPAQAPLTPGEVTVLSPRVRRILAPNPSVMTGPGTNTYLVGGIDGDGPIAVIDPGPDDPAHLDAIVAAGAGRIRWILITHTHHDHWPGAAPLAERTGAEVIAFQARDGLVIDRPLIDGGRVVGEDFTLRALHTPGHASNHLCFLLEQERLLFTGDQVMHGSTVVIWPPEGDVRTYLLSLQRLLDHEPPLRALAPAHGHVFTDPAPTIQAIVDHRSAREAKVADALRAAGRAVTVDELLPSVYADVEEHRLPIARGSLWAHLRKLVDDDRAAATAYDDLDASTWTWLDPPTQP